MPSTFSLCRVILLILLLSGLGASACAPRAAPGGKVTRETLGRIRLSMTEKEVQGLLGPPPPEKIVSNTAPAPLNLTYTIYTYETDGPGAAVFFENGRVVAANYNNEQILSNVK